MGKKKLRRSSDKVFAGVASGMAEYAELGVRQVRAFFIVAGLISGGLIFLAYVACAIFMAPPDDFDINDYREQ